MKGTASGSPRNGLRTGRRRVGPARDGGAPNGLMQSEGIPCSNPIPAHVVRIRESRRARRTQRMNSAACYVAVTFFATRKILALARVASDGSAWLTVDH